MIAAWQGSRRLVEGPYLELFARQTKRGWDCWGNQASLFDAGVVPTATSLLTQLEAVASGEPRRMK